MSEPTLTSFSPTQGELREGIPIEKSVVLTEDFLIKNETLIQKYYNFFLLYPDLFLDTIAKKNSPIHLFYYQRIFLRADMRYRYHFGTFTRGTSKSFLAILSQILACIFLPGSWRFLVSDIKKASLDITKKKVSEIFSWYPLLENEVAIRRESTDYFMLTFKDESVFQVLTLSAAARGGRYHGGIAEECAMIDGIQLSEVILPMMNLPRRGPDGLVCEGEPQQSQTYITSAGSKNTFAYERLIELLTMECLTPDQVFVWGAGYELGVYYGLLDKNFLTEQKLSTTFDAMSFARESQSVKWADIKFIELLGTLADLRETISSETHM